MATNSEHCPLCESFAAPSMKGVVRHIGLVHSHEFGFRVTCGVGGCTRSYTKFSSYKKHMYIKHRDTLGVSTRQRSPDMTASSLVFLPFKKMKKKKNSLIVLKETEAQLSSSLKRVKFTKYHSHL